MLRIPLLDDYGRGNQFREVVHGQFCKYFLDDVLHFFCMKMDETKRVLEMTEGSFDAPTSGIEFFKLIR